MEESFANIKAYCFALCKILGFEAHDVVSMEKTQSFEG